ncbi:MAG: hypothetical protein GTN49_05030 [candidate division Zixibacteria bacterium]|nr:hypothetical protein [candidate division Zixibacteria bacterium]
MRERLKSRWDIAVAAATVAVAAIYIVFRSAYYFPDPMRWELDIAARGTAAVWHPHRLLYNPLALTFEAVLKSFGYRGRLFGAMQIMSALVGAVGFALFYLMLRKAALGRPLALAGSFALAFSYGYWAYSCNAECVILSTVAAMAAFLCAQWASSTGGFRRWALCAAVAGAAVLAHFSNALLLVFVVAAYLLAKPEKRFRRLPALVASFLLPVVSAYGVVAFGVLGLRGPGEFWRWLFGVPGKSEYYMTYRLYNVVLDFYALARNVFGLRWAKDVIGGGWPARHVASAALVGAAVAALAAAFVGAAARFFKRGSRRRHAWLAAALFLPYAAFFTFRDAGGTDRWTVQAFALMFFIFASAGAAAPRRLGSVALYVLAPLLFAANFWGSIYPEADPKNNEHLAFVRFVDGLTEPGDLVVFSGVGGIGTGVYVTYFSGAETASIYYGVRDAVSFRRQIDAKFATGRRVFAGDDRPVFTSIELTVPDAAGKYRVTGGVARRLLAPYEMEYVATYEGPRYEASRFWRLSPKK